MAEQDNSQLNPWARADLERPDAYTLSLIPEQLREHYLEVIKELGAAATNLSDAHVRYNTALEERFQFFTGIAYD